MDPGAEPPVFIGDGFAGDEGASAAALRIYTRGDVCLDAYLSDALTTDPELLSDVNGWSIRFPEDLNDLRVPLGL
jgi:hypothetical protein